MKLILLILLTFFGLSSYAAEFVLNDVNVECPESSSCQLRKQRFLGLKGEYRSLLHLKDTLKVMASDGGYQSFSYTLTQKGKTYQLAIRLKLKPIIKEVNIGFLDRNFESNPSDLLLIKEGEYFEAQRMEESVANMQKRLEGMGFPHNKNQYTLVEKDEQVTVNVVITLGPPRIFKGIKTNTGSSYVHSYLNKKFYNLYNKPFDFNKFKLYLDDAQKELFTYGYYLLTMDFSPEVKGDRVTLDIKVHQDKLFAFDFKGIERETRSKLLATLTDLFRQYKRPLTEAILKQTLQEHYKELGLLNTQITLETSNFQNMYKETVHLYRIEIQEKFKTRIKKINFSGSVRYGADKLRKMFQKEAFELASLGYYDLEYFNYFADYIKNRYLKNGFVQVKVQGPIIELDAEKKFVNVEYIIQEGRQAFVRSLNFSGVPPELDEKVRQIVENKVGLAFNPIVMVEDIKKVSNLIQENGYYFSEITNANDDEIVSYTKSGAEVDIHYVINAGPIVRLNRVLYLGNDKTRKKVLSKKIQMEPGDLITPSKTRDIEAALSGTGLFNTVSVTPVKHTSKNASTDLIVKVTERDYGLVEFAPGYRTDLGIKLTGTVSYLNIGGMNRSLVLKSQVNQRFNYQVFDERRRKQKKQILEHNTSLTFNQNDIFDTMIDLGIGSSYQRKRFYSFDADIWRANTTFTRDLTKRFSSSLRYQYETISQWNATQELDNGSFKIGAITPSVTYDLRNSQTNPVKGAFFNLSCEWANPYFLSQKERDLTVNYYKLISRNRFYIPFKNGTVAISMVGGIQENLDRTVVKENNQPILNDDGRKRTEGYIPNIKVFRLTGMDIVRGYSDQEINRLPNKSDVTEERIQNRAYLANFKFEPRYFVTDNFIAGVFYDAGRVFVDRVDMGELKDSVGVTFKILTPVGTLDFDYGIKLLRDENKKGIKDDPGRFHVSIGFF